MKTMTLGEIQKFSLGILEDVHQFCIANGIHYSLAYGTLIGAIRHKGFIPWDDDVDIVMPRPDYDRFCSLYQSSRYKIATPGQSYLTFTRVFDTEKTFVKQMKRPWHPTDTGVWIDIFPMDSVSDDPKEFMKTAHKLHRIWKDQLKARYVLNPFEKPTLPKRAKCLIRKAFFRKKLSDILRKQEEMMKRYPYGTTCHISQLGCADGVSKEYFPSSIADDYVTVSFEGREFLAFKEYDKFLKSCYGDYMQLPPAKDCVPKQDKNMAFYWK